MKISDEVKVEDRDTNFNNIFKNGKGIYPIDLFKSEATYSVDDSIFSRYFNSNEEMSKYLLDIIDNLGYKLYYIDQSYLGFTALTLLVPGMSEIEVESNEESLKLLIDRYNFFESYRNIKNISIKEKENVISYLEKVNHDSSIDINEILEIPITKGYNHFEDITVDLLLTMLYIEKEDYEKAYESMKKFVNYIKEEKDSDESIRYNEIIFSIIKLKKEQCDDEEILKMLSYFYTSEEIRECLEDIKPKNIFNGLPMCNYPSCGNCEFHEKCMVKDEACLYERILKRKLG